MEPLSLLASLDGINDRHEIAVLRQVADVGARISKDSLATWEQESTYPTELHRSLRDAGLLGLTIPAEFGGLGFGVSTACLALETLAYYVGAAASIYQLAVNGPPRAIYLLGNTNQHRRYLPGVVAGERSFSIAITEREAGSTATKLATRLEPDGPGYRLYGSKCYITGAVHSTAALVFCRAAGTSGAKGLGAVIVELDNEDVSVRQMPKKMGGDAVAEAELFFDGVPIPSDAVILEPDQRSSDAARYMIRQFNPERCGNAAISLGIARAAFEQTRNHVARRRQAGRLLNELQGVRWKLAEMATALDEAHLLVDEASASTVCGFPATNMTMMAKLAANECGEMICREAIQLHGHTGYTKELPLERQYREVRGYSIAGGTLEICRNLVATELLDGSHGPDRPRCGDAVALSSWDAECPEIRRTARDIAQRSLAGGENGREKAHDLRRLVYESMTAPLERPVDALHVAGVALHEIASASIEGACAVHPWLLSPFLERFISNQGRRALARSQALKAIVACDGIGSANLTPAEDGPRLDGLARGLGNNLSCADTFVVICGESNGSPTGLQMVAIDRHAAGVSAASTGMYTDLRFANAEARLLTGGEDDLNALIEAERLGAAAMLIGLSCAALQEATLSGSVASSQGMRWQVADVAVQIAGATKLLDGALRGRQASMSAMAKLRANECVHRACDTALELLPANADHDAAERRGNASRWLARLWGTTAAMRDVVGSSIAETSVG